MEDFEDVAKERYQAQNQNLQWGFGRETIHFEPHSAKYAHKVSI